MQGHAFSWVSSLPLQLETRVSSVYSSKGVMLTKWPLVLSLTLFNDTPLTPEEEA